MRDFCLRRKKVKSFYLSLKKGERAGKEELADKYDRGGGLRKRGGSKKRRSASERYLTAGDDPKHLLP